MKFFLIQLLLLLLSTNTFAASEKSWWQDTFGTQIPLISPIESLDLLIASPGTDACSPLRKEILSGLAQYAEIASTGNSSDKAKKIATGVMKLLDYSGDSACANEGLKTYVLGSFFISYNDMIHESEHWFDSPQKYDASLDELRLTDNITVEFRNVLILALLIRENRVQFLTPTVRKALGGAWNSTQIFGAYDCEARLLSVDPTMRPFDTGSVLQHEMDHFLRDQFFSAQNIQQYFSSPGSNQVDWEAYLTLDESLASIEAAMLQREQIDDQGSVAFAQPPYNRQRTDLEAFGLYLAKDDFGFRVSTGPLESLFEQGYYNDPVQDLNDRYNPGGFQYGPSVGYPNSGTPDRAPEDFLGIFDVVHSSYFPTALDDRIKTLLVRMQPWTIDPLTRELNIPDEVTPQAFDVGINPRLALMYQEISSVKERIQKVSTGCALYVQAVLDGKVSGYAGLRFIDSGDHPGEAGSRPGESGSRPGESGSRPGESGSRPGLSVRACLSLQGKL